MKMPQDSGNSMSFNYQQGDYESWLKDLEVLSFRQKICRTVYNTPIALPQAILKLKI